MALTTQGFALSALPRSPTIPANVGAVDVKEIYDGVRQGLASFELARRAPQSMALADATMQGQTEQAPLKTRQVLAQTEGIEQQTPLKTAILASEASPAYLEAKRQALINKSTKQPAGDVQLATSLAAARQRLAEDPTDVHAAQLVAALEPIALSKSAVSAKNPQGAIDAGIQKTADTNATRADIAQLNDDRLRELAATGDETKRTLAANELATRSQIAKDRIDAQKQATQAAREQKLAVVDTKHQLALSHQLGALETLDQNTDNVNRLIDEAIKLTGPTTAGVAAKTAFLPFGARTLKGKLSSIRANVGFDALSNMRQNSPTGGALGQVSDVENKLLQDTIDALDQGLDPDVLKQNLEMVRLQRAKSLTRLKNTYDRDLDILAKPGGAQAAVPQAAAASTAFATPADADAAAAAGTIKSGDRITVGGVPGTWK